MYLSFSIFFIEYFQFFIDFCYLLFVSRGRMGRGRGMGRGLGSRRGGRREMVGGQMVIDHDDDNLSDKEVYSKNIPAIGEY